MSTAQQTRETLRPGVTHELAGVGPVTFLFRNRDLIDLEADLDALYVAWRAEAEAGHDAAINAQQDAAAAAGKPAPPLPPSLLDALKFITRRWPLKVTFALLRYATAHEGRDLSEQVSVAQLNEVATVEALFRAFAQALGYPDIVDEVLAAKREAQSPPPAAGDEPAEVAGE